MRLGEIKQIVDEAVTKQGQVYLEEEALFGGQAYLIKNYADVIAMLTILNDQAWNTVDFAPVEAIKAAHGSDATQVQISQTEYADLSNYINAVNQSLPIFTGILDTIVSEQDEQVINIKLPESIASLDTLSRTTSRLSKLLKEFTIDGNVKFSGFDTGTDWVVVTLVGVETYRVFIGCLRIAQEFYKARAEYYKSETAKVNYLGALKALGIQDDPGKEKEMAENVIALEIEQKVDEVLELVKDRNGSEPQELRSTIIKATNELIKELGHDVEFHLSLNPPAYASESAGGLKIDYVQIRKLNEKSSSPKGIEAGEAGEDQ